MILLSYSKAKYKKTVLKVQGRVLQCRIAGDANVASGLKCIYM